MAKRKKSHAGHRPKRRKKVSGVHEIVHVVGQVAAAGLGGIVGAFGVNAVKTGLGTSLPAWMPAAGAVATGALVAGFAKKVPYGQEFGVGMAAVGGVMMANEIGLNVPGISGLAMASNAPGNAATLRSSVGCNKMGAGPNAYLKSTVGATKGKRMSAMGVGALIAN